MFAPALGDTFDVLKAGGGITGTFSMLDLPVLGGGLGWQVNYLTNFVQLEVIEVAMLAGDFDCDGDVDGDDLNDRWKPGFGLGSLADADDDGDSDGDDFLTWQRQVGSPGAVPSSTAASAAVPEPSGAALGLPLIGGAALRLRRRGY